MDASSLEVSRRVPQSSSRTFSASLLFNPFDPSVNVDPYPHYQRLRTVEPVHWSKLGVWFVGRYADVRPALKDRRLRVRDIPQLLRSKGKLVQTEALSPEQPHRIDSLVENSEGWLAFQEGANHKRLRGVYATCLGRTYIEAMRPVARQVARELLERQASQGQMDLMKDFARHIPLSIISRMVGIDQEMLPSIQGWARILTRFVVSYTSLEDLGTIDTSVARFVSYLRQAIALRRREPRDDLISKLCAENSALGEGLTEQELTSVCVFLVVAGMEAVENVIGNGMFALLAHPEEMRYLSANLDIIPSAVEELLRFETPLQLVMRLALEDVEIGGRHIPAGDYVYLVLGSANRDPERFDRPDDLLFDRAQNHHLSFGDGHHLCVGAQLARVQGQEALRALLEMMPQMTLATDELNWGSNLNWGRSLLSRGLLSLPVRFAGAR